MPQQFLNAAQIRAVVQQVRRETVTQGVRTDPGIKPGHREVLVELPANRPRAERLTVLVQEDALRAGTVLALGIQGAHVEVPLQRLDGLASDGRQSVFAPLTADAQNAFDQVEILHLQVDQFADADAAAVQHFQHRAITGAQQVAVAGRFQQLLHLFQVEAFGEPLFLLGGADRAQRVHRDQAAADQKLVEAAQGGQFARGGALGVVLTVEVRQELADRQRFTLEQLLVDRDVGAAEAGRLGVFAADLATEELGKLRQVGAIALDGVVAEMLLELEILEKLPDKRREILLNRGFPPPIPAPRRRVGGLGRSVDPLGWDGTGPGFVDDGAPVKPAAAGALGFMGVSREESMRNRSHLPRRAGGAKPGAPEHDVWPNREPILRSRAETSLSQD